MSESEYMTVAEARDFLGVSRRKIADLIEKGCWRRSQIRLTTDQSCCVARLLRH